MGNMSDNSPDIQTVLSRLTKFKKQGSGFVGLCPAHNDKKFSLSIAHGRDGRILLHCFVGCPYQAILAAMNLQSSDVNPSPRPTAQIANYKYTDAAGQVAYEKVRFEPKAFFQRRFDQTGRSVWALSAGWYEYKDWGEKSGYYKIKLDKTTYAEDSNSKPNPDAVWFDHCPRYLYGQTQLQTLAPSSLVLSFEGEKGAERAGFEFGITSIAVGGATGWRSHFAESLHGFDLIIFPDADPPGRKLATEQAAACLNIAARVRIVELPGLQQGQDIFDWIESGGTWAQLQEIIAATPDYRPDAIADGAIDELEFIGEDLPISSDKQRERYLRQLARNSSKVMDAVVQILNKLGFKEDHSRLLNTLTICARDRLGEVAIKHAWLASKYPRGGMSQSTVARDIARLRDEQSAIGVEILGYTPGTKNPNLDYGYASKFTLHFLRYALHAIDLAIDTKGDFDYSFQALDAACDVVVSNMPRFKPEKSAKAVQRERAEMMAEQTSGAAVKEQAAVGVRLALDEFYQTMLDAGFSLEEAVESLNRENSEAVERVSRSITAVKCAQPPVKRAAHKSNTEIAYSERMMVGNIDGQQNDDHVRARVATSTPPEDAQMEDF